MGVSRINRKGIRNNNKIGIRSIDNRRFGIITKNINRKNSSRISIDSFIKNRISINNITINNRITINIITINIDTRSIIRSTTSRSTQARRLWKDIGEALGWRESRAPSVRYLWEGKATYAVLEFPAHHKLGCVGVGRVPPEDRGEDESGEEGGPGPP